MADGETLEALMARYVRGDADAFDEVYARTAQRVFAFHMVMSSERFRAEDLTQVTFLKLHRARAGYIEGDEQICGRWRGQLHAE